PAYTVLDQPAANIEIRSYGPRLAAEVDLDQGDQAGRGQAFGLLFSYISGANRGAAGAPERVAMTAPVDVARPAKIAMTAPVETATDGGVRMRFFLPARYSSADAPTPTDDRVKIVTVPAQTVATLRFSGTGRDLAPRQQQLIAALADSHWKPVGTPYGLFYDAPFTIPFLRRNEAAVAVAPR
ncbi:SOUL family heme-binding protein, partial [Rhodopseudomonas palustris]